MVPPPLPPRPQQVYRRHLALNVVLLVCTLGLWLPFWVLVWWTVDARNFAEEQRFRREWAAYQEALATWRWQQIMPPPS